MKPRINLLISRQTRKLAVQAIIILTTLTAVPLTQASWLSSAARNVEKTVAKANDDATNTLAEANKDATNALTTAGHDSANALDKAYKDTESTVHKAVKDIGEMGNKAGLWFSKQIGFKGLMDKANNLLNQLQGLFDQFMAALNNMGKLAPVIGVACLVLVGLLAFWIAGNALKAWDISPRFALVVIGLGLAAWMLAQPAEPVNGAPGPDLVAQQK